MKERRELFCYDEHAEFKLRLHYDYVVQLVNVWTIPLLKSMGKEATPENICKAVKHGVKEYFIDEITSVAISDASALAARQAYKSKAESILSDTLAEIIKATPEYKAIDAEKVKPYTRHTWQGVEHVEEHERSEEAREALRKKAIERGKAEFNDCLQGYKRMGRSLENALSKGILRWSESGFVEFNDEQVKESCALYLEGKAEIDCVARLETLVKAINAAYKGGLQDIRYITYLLSCKDGTAYLNRQEIGIDDLEKYGPFDEA